MEFTVFLVALGFLSGVSSQCVDMDTQACILLEHSNPDLCKDPSLSSTACPRHCNMCPLTCYFCEGPVKDFNQCNTTMLCDVGQRCMLRHLKSSADNHHEYVAGCANLDVCDAGLTFSFGRRDVNTRNVEVSCCTTDLCNTPLTTTTTTPVTTTTHTTAPTTTTPKPTTTTTKSPVCMRDILLFLEDSNGLGTGGSGGFLSNAFLTTHNSQDLKHFLADLVNDLDIGYHANLVEVATFDNNVHNQWDLDAYTSHHALTEAIHNIHFERDTNRVETEDLINFLVHSAFIPRHGDRPSVSNDIVIIVDHRGDADERLTSLQEQHVASYSGNIIVIDVGQKNAGSAASTLSVLATDWHHYFHVNSYADLHSIQSTVASLLCS